MGFTLHPGALPFVTVRRQQWANRLTLGENIEIHGEHGCPMPPIAAKVVSINLYIGEALPAYKAIYGNQALVNIGLSKTDEPWVKVEEDWVRERETWRGAPCSIEIDLEALASRAPLTFRGVPIQFDTDMRLPEEKVLDAHKKKP